MGFSDDYTLIPLPRSIRKQRKSEPDAHYAAYLARQPMAKDGPRYKALGNSMAVNCMRWIGMRIQMVEELGRPWRCAITGDDFQCGECPDECVDGIYCRCEA